MNATKLLLCIIILSLPLAASAQIDNFGAVDTLFAEAYKIDDLNWGINVIYFNDENVDAFSIPLHFTAKNNKLVADSAVYVGGRVETFSYKGFRPDSAIQCVTLGILANLGPTSKMVTPGKGRIVTVFISSLEDKPIEGFTVDTTTTSPNNSLMVMASRLQGEGLTDTIPLTEHKKKEILPAFKVIKP